MANIIEPGHQYGDVRAQVKRLGSGGMSTDALTEMSRRFESFMPGLASSAGVARSRIDDMLPQDADWAGSGAMSRTANGNFGGLGSGGKSVMTQQQPYQPEFSSPDRQNYPVHRILANRYWRLFYKLDPTAGAAIDMMSDLPWSQFELTGDGVEGEIRQQYEKMCEVTQILALLPYFIKEYLVIGEVIPQCYFDTAEGIWTFVAMHNPDQVNVIDAPFVKMDPILEFVPDNRLTKVLNSNAPGMAEIRRSMPPELFNRLTSGQNIPLSNINATFLSRKMHPYDVRGTSILSRLWRVFMYEDAIFNASIQVARRTAAPLRVAKLGNAQTGWIPGPDQERRLLDLLAQTEMDPASWLVYHYGIAFEMVGISDRHLSINREWDVIERIKLAGLGISKAFTSGEISYASASSSLQVFLQRILGLRNHFEQTWLYPKFFLPIAQINGWVKPKANEINHRYRVKRSAREIEEQNRYIIPTIVWRKKLDAAVPSDLVNAIVALDSIGIKFSKTSIMAATGHNFEEETKKRHREQEFEKKFLPTLPGKDDKPGGGGGGGMAGGGEPAPEGAPGEEAAPPEGTPESAPPTGNEAPPGAAPAALDLAADKAKPAIVTPESETKKAKPGKAKNTSLKSKIWVDNKFGNWDAEEVQSLMDLVQDQESEDAFWSQLGEIPEFKSAVQHEDFPLMWDQIAKYLDDHEYPDQDIAELKKILEAEGLNFEKVVSYNSQEVLDAMDDNALAKDDVAFNEFVGEILARTKKAKAEDGSKPDKLLAGTGTIPYSTFGKKLSGDVSQLIKQKKSKK